MTKVTMGKEEGIQSEAKIVNEEIGKKYRSHRDAAVFASVVAGWSLVTFLGMSFPAPSFGKAPFAAGFIVSIGFGAYHALEAVRCAIKDAVGPKTPSASWAARSGDAPRQG